MAKKITTNKEGSFLTYTSLKERVELLKFNLKDIDRTRYIVNGLKKDLKRTIDDIEQLMVNAKKGEAPPKLYELLNAILLEFVLDEEILYSERDFFGIKNKSQKLYKLLKKSELDFKEDIEFFQTQTARFNELYVRSEHQMELQSSKK